MPKQEFTAQFEELVVKRVRNGLGFGAVGRDLGPGAPANRDGVRLPRSGG